MAGSGPARKAEKGKRKGPRKGKESNGGEDEKQKATNTECTGSRGRGAGGLGTISSSGTVKLLYTNAQSVVNKVNLLKAHVCETSPDIIAITESWTHEELNESTLKIDNYEIIARCDRTDTNDGRGGGVLLYSCLPNISEYNSKNEFSQHLAVTISNEKEPDLHLHVIYRSPNSSEDNNERLLKYIETLPENSVVIGDFNLPKIDWTTLSVNATESSLSKRFLDVSLDRFLHQHVDFPTNLTPHGNEKMTETCIDLLFTDNRDTVASVKSNGHLGKSKHVMIEAEIIIPTMENKTDEMIPDYKKADFNEIRNSISAINWENILSEADTITSWELFKTKLLSTIEESIPKKKRRCSNRPLWMIQNVMRTIRKKRRLWKWYCTTKDYEDYQAYQKTCSIARKAVRKAKRNLERKLARDAKTNCKPFYRYLNSCTKTRTKVGPLRDDDGVLQTDDQKMAEMLNKTFISAFTEEDLSTMPTPEQLFVGDSPLSDILITEKMIRRKIDALDPNKSPGPDQIHPTVVKELADILSTPLKIIFNKSLEEGVVPHDWRIANVTSIFKKGNRTLAFNYRPISLTSIMSNIRITAEGCYCCSSSKARVNT